MENSEDRSPPPLTVRSGGPPPDARISEERAREIWERAAQLQAEALHRPDSIVRSAPQDAVQARESTGLRVADVEAAAVEAGISAEFVRLALAESATVPFAAKPLPDWMDRAATKLLGSDRRSIEVRRLIEVPPADVLAAMERVFPAHPYLLTLHETVGGHPLEGGVLVFKVPKYGVSNQTPFALALAYADFKQLHVGLRPVQRESRDATEVVVACDLRSGVRASWWVGSTAVGAGTIGGAAAGGLGGGAAAIALNLVGAAALGLVVVPAVLGAAALGGLVRLGSKALYRYGVRQGVQGVDDLLRALDQSTRPGGGFPLPPPRGALPDTRKS